MLLRLCQFAHSNTAFRAVRKVRAVIDPELLNVRVFYVTAIRLIHTLDCIFGAKLRVESLVDVEVLRAGIDVQHWLRKQIDVHSTTGMVFQLCGVAEINWLIPKPELVSGVEACQFLIIIAVDIFSVFAVFGVVLGIVV